MARGDPPVSSAARDLDRLNLGAGTGGEDSADGLFDAALDFVQQSHGPSPFLMAAGQRSFRNSVSNFCEPAVSGHSYIRYYWACLGMASTDAAGPTSK